MDKNIIPTDIRPPAAPEIEASILGAILIEKEAISRVIPILAVDKFYLKEHQLIYKAMLNLFEQNNPIDTITLFDELKKQCQIDEVGGLVKLSKLSQNISSAANIEFHAKIIHEKFILRELISTSHQIASAAYQGLEDPFEIIEQAERKIFNLTQINFKNYVSMKDAALKFAEKLENKNEVFIETGFYDLDKILNISKSDLIILAARPSIGKTSLALDIIRNVCKTKPVGFFSLEMTYDEIVARNISQKADLTYHEVINKSDPDKISKAFYKVLDYNIFLDDTSSISLTELRSKARRMKIKQHIEFLAVDYLQLMQTKAESREREISILSSGLKAIAKDLNIPVLALSQLNRKAEGRNDKKPSLSDLRDSGSLEQDADAVLLIHRPEYYEIGKFEDGTPSAGKAIVIVAKQRNGKTGEVKLGFKKEIASFYNLEFRNYPDTEPVKNFYEKEEPEEAVI
jgi:replicative DNA helicase